MTYIKKTQIQGNSPADAAIDLEANKSGNQITASFLEEVAKGNVVGHSIIHKFGKSTNTGTSYAPVSLGNIYNTPQVAGATALRVKAGNTNDTAAGSGAREITIQGLDETGALVSEAVATAGTSASSATSATFIRMFRCYVSASGTYATSAAGSHAADIVIENGAGGTDWATIDSTGFPRGQSEIGIYSVPVACTGFLLNAYGFSDSTKITNFLFFRRENILETSAPYSAMRLLFEERSEGGEFAYNPKAPVSIGTVSDVGFMAKVDTGSAEVEVDFEILLIDNNYL